jgi:hypothetical protein
VPLVGAALVVAGCTGGSAAAPTTTPSQVTSSSSPAPVADPAGVKALRIAVGRTTAIRQFTFAATTSVAAKQTVRTTLSGRVIRGRGIAYTLTVNGNRTQVVRISAATYVRPVPGNWSKLATPRAVAHPTATLLALLRRMTPTSVSHPAGRTRVSGVLSSAAAKAVGVPSSGAPAHAAVLLDRSGRVLGAVLDGGTTAGGRPVQVSVVTHYGHFGHVRAIRRP